MSWWVSDTVANQIVANFSIGKRNPDLFRNLHTVLMFDYPNARDRAKVIQQLTENVKAQELHAQIGAITSMEITPFKALEEVKKIIEDYYVMVYKYIQTESKLPSAIPVTHGKPTSKSKRHTQEEWNANQPTQIHLAEDLFNRENPLFWIALFLYQKELNSAVRLCQKLRKEVKDKEMLYKFFLLHRHELKSLVEEHKLEVEQWIDKAPLLPEEDVWEESEEKEKKPYVSPAQKQYSRLLAELVYADDTTFVDKYRKLQAYDFEKMILEFHDEIELKKQIYAALERENAPLERMFTSTRSHAKDLIKDFQFMDALRDNLIAIAAKFHDKNLNPLQKYSRLMRQLVQLRDLLTHTDNKAMSAIEFMAARKELSIEVNAYDEYLNNDEDETVRKEGVKKALEAIKGDQSIIGSDKWLNEILTNHLQFSQTMTWFAHETYSHAVKNINIAIDSFSVPKADTLKWRLDAICGTIRKHRFAFEKFEVPVPDKQLLLTTPKADTKKKKDEDEWDLLNDEEIKDLTASLLASIQGKHD